MGGVGNGDVGQKSQDSDVEAFGKAQARADGQKFR